METHLDSNSQTGRTNQQIEVSVGKKLKSIVLFYVDGFRNMTIGRYLWLIILIKLLIMFDVLKLFFFPDKLANEYDNDEQRADAVREALISND